MTACERSRPNAPCCVVGTEVIAVIEETQGRVFPKITLQRVHFRLVFFLSLHLKTSPSGEAEAKASMPSVEECQSNSCSLHSGLIL